MKHIPTIFHKTVLKYFFQESKSQEEQENQTAGEEEKEGRGDQKK